MVENSYEPPTSAEMAANQDDETALRLLLAQRRLYKRAKFWLNIRWAGVLVIGLAAPLVSVIVPEWAVWSGAVAGLWLFLGRTLMDFAQANETAKAAAVQEQFDFHVYGMPRSERGFLPSLEDVAALAGKDDQLREAATKSKLTGWYSISETNSPLVTVAICQRTNASYANRLLRRTAVTWTVVSSVWLLILITISIVADLSLLVFLVGVLLPLLPGFLDVVEFIRGIWNAARERSDLCRLIEVRMKDRARPLKAADVFVWQERLFALRRATPQVPDLIYKFQRDVNEQAMHSAARQISDQVREE